MRELTEYEKEKWFDEYGSFRMEFCDFLTRGDELGEAFDSVLNCIDRDYCLDAEFVAAAQVQALDMYYYQMYLYTGEYGGNDTPESLRLPPAQEFIAKAHEYGAPVYIDASNEACMKAWDWAMDWREEHWGQTAREREIAYLEQQLEFLKGSENVGSN